MSKANTRVVDLPENSNPQGHENFYIATDTTDEKISISGFRSFLARFFLVRSNNLSDLTDFQQARDFLSVYSKDQIDGVNKSQNDAIIAINNHNTQLDTSIAGIIEKNITQDLRLDAVESKNTTQDEGIREVKNKNTAQDARLDAIEEKNISQDSAIDGKSDKGHTHNSSEVTDFKTATYDQIKKSLLAGDNMSIIEENGKLKFFSSGGSGGGDMLKNVYDKTNIGKVDLSQDTEKLGGQNPEYYASKGSVDALKAKVQENSDNIGYLGSILDSNTHDIAKKANDSDVVHKTGDESISGKKTFLTPFAYKQNVSGDSNIEYRTASDTWWHKPVVSYYKSFGTVDTPADINISNDSRSVLFSNRGFGRVGGTDKSLYDYQVSAYKGGDGNFYGEVIENLVGGQHFFRDTNVTLEGKSLGAWWGSQLHFNKDVKGTDNANIGWHIGGRSDWGDSLLFEFNSNATGARQPLNISKDGRIFSRYYTDAEARNFIIGSRYSISGISHGNGGLNYQILWGDTANNGEGSGNDGGWGLFFGAIGNPYMYFRTEDTVLGRVGGALYLKGRQINIEGKTAVDIRYAYGSSPNISLAIGDNDTGVNWEGDGRISVYANSTNIQEFNTSRRPLATNLGGQPFVYVLSLNDYNNIGKDGNTLYLCY